MTAFALLAAFILPIVFSPTGDDLREQRRAALEKLARQRFLAVATATYLPSGCCREPSTEA